MASSSWKSIERAVAELVGGKRTWNSEEDIDVQTDDYAIEVKHLRAPSIADVERILIHNDPKAKAVGKRSALVVKRAAGRGRPSPFLAVFVLEPDVSLPEKLQEQQDKESK